MIARAALVLVLAPVLSACAYWPGTKQSPPCPDILSAEAWVNAMPGPGQPDRSLIVQVRVDSPDAWQLVQDPATTPQALVLALAPGGSGVTGVAGFRDSPSEPGRTSVAITCDGRQVAAISKITIAR